MGRASLKSGMSPKERLYRLQNNVRESSGPPWSKVLIRLRCLWGSGLNTTDSGRWVTHCHGPKTSGE